LSYCIVEIEGNGIYALVNMKELLAYAAELEKYNNSKHPQEC
jgi:hypothetical protein